MYCILINLNNYDNLTLIIKTIKNIALKLIKKIEQYKIILI